MRPALVFEVAAREPAEANIYTPGSGILREYWHALE